MDVIEDDKGGSRVLGKGGDKQNRDDCACYGTIHGPSARGCDALGVAGGWSPLHNSASCSHEYLSVRRPA